MRRAPADYVTCPRCGAHSFNACRTARGQERTPHAARMLCAASTKCRAGQGVLRVNTHETPTTATMVVDWCTLAIGHQGPHRFEVTNGGV